MSAAHRNEPLPPGVARWNWGAFLLNWIWGIGNHTFVALLALVPFVGFIMLFVLGARGSEWAWRNKRWESVEHFKRVQRRWAIAGVIAWLAMLGVIAATFFLVISALTRSDVYTGAVGKLNATPAALELLGAPIVPGFPMGNFSLDAATGAAQFSIPVEGSKARGTVYVDATRDLGIWTYNRIELAVEGQDRRIDLNTGHSILPRSRSEEQAALEGLADSRAL
jgi:hypothetical protein